MHRKFAFIAFLILITAAATLPAADAPKPETLTYTVKYKSLPAEAGELDNAIEVTAKDKDGKKISGITIQATVDGDAVFTDDKKTVTRTTNADGSATFALTAKTDRVLHVDIAPLSSAKKPIESKTKRVILAAPEALQYAIDGKDLPLKAAEKTEKALTVTVKTPGGEPVPGVIVTATMDDATDAEFPSGRTATGETDDKGLATFDITTKTNLIAIVRLAAGTKKITAADEPRILTPSPGALKYTVEIRKGSFGVQENAPDAVKITASNADGIGVPHIKIKAALDPVNGKKSDAQFYFEDQKGPSVIGETDANGVATFGILTNKDTRLKGRFIPISRDGKKEFAERVEVVELEGSLFVTSLGSKRAYVQLFVGQTFTNNYSTEDPKETNEHTSVGFQNGGPLIRLTFDTMWPHQKPSQWQCKHDCIKNCNTDGCRTACDDCTRTCDDKCSTLLTCLDPKNANTSLCTAPFKPAFDNREHSWRHGLWHTDASLEFSRFPFGSKAGDIEKENEKGLKDAFSGALGLTFQPNRLASFDKRDSNDISPQDPQPYDAYRFGFFSHAGITTRAQSEPSGNTSINRIQFGVRFTHSRSSKSNPVDEDRNEIPIRFVELSYARFSEWGNFPNNNDGAGRVVIDAGLRVTALSNLVFPVYVGGHFNMGPGPDDMRVFLGMLVKLDFLGRLVQGTVGNPEAAIK